MKKLIAYSSVAHMGFVTMGIFAMNARGHPGRDLPDAVARPRLRRAVPVRRRRLRPHAHARDRRLWRAGQQHAEIRRRLHGLHHGQCRPAGHQRLHRRVPDAARRLPGQHLGGALRHHRRHPVGRLCALALPPGDLRRADQGKPEGPARPFAAREGDPLSAGRAGHLLRRLSGAGLRRDRGLGRGAASTTSPLRSTPRKTAAAN